MHTAHAMTSRFFSQEKKRLVSILMALGLAVAGSPASAQGIPVIDVAGLIQALQQLVNLRQQLTQMQQQYQVLDQQYRAVTGNRDLGTILNDHALANHLPSQWQGVYRKVKAGVLPGVSDQARGIRQAEAMTGGTAGQQRDDDTLSANGALAMRGYDQALARLDNIQALMQRANTTQDAAAKADLQNRLSAEVAMVNNEQTRMLLMGQLAEVEMQLAARQQFREFHRGTFLQGVR